MQKLLKRFHPEGIPWPMSVLYNGISGTSVFERHYALVAMDAERYGMAGAILDIGTGPGRLLMKLREVFPDASLVGVDISEAIIEQARRNLAQDETIDVRVADAASLPFDDRTFDLVLSTGSLHHWKQPLKALEEAHRVLRPGGVALVYDLVRKMPATVAASVRREFGGFRMALLWLHSFEEPFFEPTEMETLVKASVFGASEMHFVGALCCMVLRKGG